MNNLLTHDLIILDSDAKTKAEILDSMIEKIAGTGRISDKNEFKKEILEREKISPTALGEGIAIPHAKTKAVKVPSIVFARSKDFIDFESGDEDALCNLFFMIAAPENAKNSHIEMLTQISSLLLDDVVKDKLVKAKENIDILNILTLKVNNEEVEDIMSQSKFIVAVTACPVGVAHTYIAADKLEKTAAEMGVKIKVETNGSVGVKNKLTSEEIKQADAVIVAADKNIEMERFAGKEVIHASVKDGIKLPEKLISSALNGEGEVYMSSKNSFGAKKSNEKKGVYKHLMNGVSHMLPLVVVGGVLIALSIALSGIKAGAGADVTNPMLKEMLNIGVKAFGLMVPILAGYIAYSIAERPGLAPGLVGGAIANEIGAGFLGGIIAGFLAGYVAKWVKSWKIPEQLMPLMPIFIIPLVSTLVVGVAMMIVGAPIKGIMDGLTAMLKSMEAGSVVLAVILGLMIAFDMGGPVNKVAFLFGAAMIQEGVPQVMGPIAAAICIPPISLGLATLMNPKKFSEEERESGKAALAMGTIGITEGAIPFAAADPLRVIPSIMTGSAIGAAIAALGKVADHAPHGGLIVLPVVDGKITFIIAIIVGSLVSALMVSFLKKDQSAATA